MKLSRIFAITTVGMLLLACSGAKEEPVMTRGRSVTLTGIIGMASDSPDTRSLTAQGKKTFAVGDNQFPWGDDITNNIRIATVYADCKAGLNLLKISPVTPNIVIEKIVIHEANTKMPSSYLGAPETFFL